MTAQTVLISGAGIGGLTLAYWLNAAGFDVTIIEHAPTLRSGGYVIDFWGLGYDIAEYMDLSDKINSAGYHIREMRIVNSEGERISGRSLLKVATRRNGGGPSNHGKSPAEAGLLSH